VGTKDKDKISCMLCDAKIHAVQLHLKEDHPGVTFAEYKTQFPDAPLLSNKAKEEIMKKREVAALAVTGNQKAFHEIFDLGEAKAARNSMGNPIMINMVESDPDYADLVPVKDPNYIFPIDTLKNVVMGLELKIPTMLWGHAGVGKTTLFEQSCACLGRPFLRIQHTVNTEESHIVGQWIVRSGDTKYELGPLAVAMKYGLVYCADEYDMALPSVVAVYQPVLEGKPLVIKDADAENRIIRPHPNFRFVATGNTNGVGDETGLYQGTNIQNAANYERFGIVEEVGYMPDKQEVGVIAAQSGIPKEDAENLVKFATEVRKCYKSGKISLTVSPRALINAGKLGMRRGDYKIGLQLALINRMTEVDREVCNGFAQRIFG
jgi:cobaltochelatase CobS